MIFCPHFPARQYGDMGQSSTMWGMGGLSISSLSLWDMGELQPRHQDRQLLLHTASKCGIRVRHNPLGFCLVQRSLPHCRRIRDRTETAIFLDYYLDMSGGLGLRTCRKSSLVLGNGWTARASAAGRTCSVPPSYIFQWHSCPQGTSHSGRSLQFFIYPVAQHLFSNFCVNFTAFASVSALLFKWMCCSSIFN